MGTVLYLCSNTQVEPDICTMQETHILSEIMPCSSEVTSSLKAGSGWYFPFEEDLDYWAINKLRKIPVIYVKPTHLPAL